MGNRFGFKDFVIVVLLVAVIVLVLLSMKQYDRQWQVVQTINTKLQEHTSDLADIRRQLARGVLPTNTSGSAGPNINLPPGKWLGVGDDPFIRIEQSRQKPGYARGDWLVDAFRAKVARITPMITTDAYGSAVQAYVLESLLTRDPVTLAFQPLLAQAWTVSEDGLTYKFIMRPGVTFSDGTPVTAKDVEFTFNLIMNKKIETPHLRGYFEKIKSCKALSESEVVFEFVEPYFESLDLAGGMSVLPAHFYGKYSPEEINSHPGLLMGSGAYRMETPDGWGPGKPLILYRNERYWGQPPAFDRLVYEQVDSDIAQINLFRNQKIDFLAAMPEQYRVMQKDTEMMARSQVFEIERISGGYGFIGWNASRKGKPTIFADKRVRQAMSCLVNYDRLFNDVLLGYGIPVTGPFSRLGSQADKSLKPYTFDPAKASQLLAAAGYVRGSDGVLVKDGVPLKFKITIPSGSDFWERVLMPLKTDMASVGVVMDLDPLEWAVFSDKLKNRDFDALCMAWGGDIETDIHQMFHSKMIDDGGQNFINYRNPKLDSLIDEARRTIDPEKRMPLWQAAHRELYEDQPYTFLYTRRSISVIDKRISNIEKLPQGLNPRGEWFVPAGLQRHTK